VRGVPPAYRRRPLSVSCRPVTRLSEGGSSLPSHAAYEPQLTGKIRTDQKLMKPNIRAIYDTLRPATVDFSNFSKFLVKTLKIHNFVNNRPIFTGFVLNDVEYEYLQLFFCIKVEFMKNKTSLGGPPSDSPGWRQLARRSPHHSTGLRYHENFKVRSKP